MKEVFATGRFDLLFASGFGNIALADRVQAIDLTDFSFAMLEKAFASRTRSRPDDLPPLLGPEFFARAEERTVANLAEVQANPRNGPRIGQALLVAARGREATRALLEDARGLAVDADRFAPNLPFLSSRGRDEHTGPGEDLPPFLSALALAARLEARRPGPMRSIRDAIAGALARGGAAGVSPEDGLGVCTRIGYPLFAAHLLLWEVLLRSKEE